MKTKLLIIALSLCSSIAVAQSPMASDILTMEMLRMNHTTSHTSIAFATALESANSLLHKNMRNSAEDYKKINAALDKYYKAFEVIDAVLAGANLAGNVWETISLIKERIEDVDDLVKMYREQVNIRMKKHLEMLNNNGKVWNKAKGIYESFKEGSFVITPDDTIIYTTSAKMVNNIINDCDKIGNSALTLAAFATGKMAFKTYDVTVNFNLINKRLDNIKRSVDDCYLTLWTYITLRRHLWTPIHKHEVNKPEICKNALDRWKGAAVEALSRKKVK